MTPALEALATALGDVDNLILHHPKAATSTRGRPITDEGPLLRSCVLLTYAAWEVYVEDSLIWAVEQLAGASAPDQLPQALRLFVAKTVANDPWSLAGEKWRGVAVAAATTRVRGNPKKGSSGLNTAGPAQIVELHNEVLGQRLLDQCRWQKMSTARVKGALAELIEVRGAIAHTGQPLGPLHLKGVVSWRNFVERLAALLDRQLISWVESIAVGPA